MAAACAPWSIESNGLANLLQPSSPAPCAKSCVSSTCMPGASPCAHWLRNPASVIGSSGWAGTRRQAHPVAMGTSSCRSGRRDSLGLSFEAASTGITSAATNILGCRTVLADARWYFEPGD
jgi:hypothetical protein